MEMTVTAAAKFLNVSERTIFRRLKVGSLHKKADSEQLLVLIDTDSPDFDVTDGHDTDSPGDSLSVEDDTSILVIKQLELELESMKLQLEMKDQQIEFFRRESQRLQLQLAAHNQGLFKRMCSLFGLRRSLPISEN